MKNWIIGALVAIIAVALAACARDMPVASPPVAAETATATAEATPEPTAAGYLDDYLILGDQWYEHNRAISLLLSVLATGSEGSREVALRALYENLAEAVRLGEEIIALEAPDGLRYFDSLIEEAFELGNMGYYWIETGYRTGNMEDVNAGSHYLIGAAVKLDEAAEHFQGLRR